MICSANDESSNHAEEKRDPYGTQNVLFPFVFRQFKPDVNLRAFFFHDLKLCKHWDDFLVHFLQ